MIDLVVIHHTKLDKFLQTEIHGTPIVYFDKSGVVRSAPLDREALASRVRGRIEALRVNFDLFHVLAPKDAWRGNALDAPAFYHAFIRRPLVEMLRIARRPERHAFHVRYARHDFPADLLDELAALFYVRDAEDLLEKHERAVRLFEQALRDARSALPGGS